LTNIASISAEYRQLVLAHNILRHVLPLVRPYLIFSSQNANATKQQRHFLHSVAWLLATLVPNEIPLSAAQMKLLLHILHVLLHTQCCHVDAEIVLPCCLVLHRLTVDIGRCRRDARECAAWMCGELPFVLIDSGLVDVFLRILRNDFKYNRQVKYVVLRTVGNLAALTDRVTSALVQRCGFFSAVNVLLQSTSKSLRRETMLLLSNVAAGRVEHIERTLSDSDLLRRIMHILVHDKQVDISVHNHGMWLLYNTVSGGTPQQVATAVDAGAIDAFCKHITNCVRRQSYGETLAVCITGLSCILGVGWMRMCDRGHGPNEYKHFVVAAGVVPAFESLSINNVVPYTIKNQIYILMETYLSNLDDFFIFTA